MDARDFRETHGDPTTWTVADIETHQNLAANDAYETALNLRAAARTCQEIADRHEAKGRHRLASAT